MKLNAFQLTEPVPQCRECYALAVLRPWIDVNSVGTMVLDELESRFNATEIGTLSTPGRFYDFTRYRPTIHLDNGIRDMTIPNTTIHYAERPGLPSLLLFRLLEPHSQSELYVSSVIKVLTHFKVTKYVLLGSMYDSVPHTRPLLVSGYGMGEKALADVRKAGVMPISYQGPSSMVNLVTQKAAARGINACSFVVSVPQYVVLEEDYLGKVRLMEILNLLYDIPVDKEDFEKALEQRNSITEKVETSPEASILLPQLETAYDLRVKAMESAGVPHLTAEMEEVFWNIMGKDIGKA
jgi:predicted ATP-grasp superfamily ATP-dependent carboligase